MTSPTAYEFFALGTATTSALSGMLMTEACAGAGVMTVTRWNVTSTFVMHAAAASLIGAWVSLDAQSIGLLMLSGVLAITIAAPAYYGSMALLGARPAVLVFSLNAPLTYLIGVLLLGERPSFVALAGLALVLAGIAVATLPGPGSPRIAQSRLWLGIGLGLLAALGQAGGTVAARPAMLAGSDPFAAMAVRFGIAALPLVLMQMTGLARHFRTSSTTPMPFLYALLGSLVGNGIGMTLLMVALAHAQAGEVATLAATSPILILPMVWVRQRRVPGLVAWLGALVTCGGTALVLAR